MHMLKQTLPYSSGNLTVLNPFDIYALLLLLLLLLLLRSHFSHV